MSAEQMMDTIIKEVQGSLNGLQVALRNLCALEDQEVDPDEDFKEAVALEDATVDLTETITQILKDLVPVVGELRGPAPKDSKAWWTKHKAERKAERKAEADARKNEIALAKEAAKEAAKDDLPGVPE